MTLKLRVTQTKSTIGEQHPMRATIRGLGLRGLGSSVVVSNTPVSGSACWLWACPSPAC